MRLLLLLLAALSVQAAPPDLRPEIEVPGRVDDISVSPLGHLWLPTSGGYVYRSEDGGRSRFQVAPPSWVTIA